MSMEEQVLRALKERFRFKNVSGEWMQGGECPECHKRELFCAANDPKIVRCGRQDKCGYQATVRELFPDLFENWSRRYPVSDEAPNAAADAYLEFERGLDLKLLRGSYAQEIFRDRDTGATSATVRFTIGDTWWERIIDRPGRFQKKAHFRPGGKWNGHCWIPPRWTMRDLANADEILIAEGIFDAAALSEVGRHAVSAMSCNTWPDRFLAELRAAIEQERRVDRPHLVFAYDVGPAGTKWARTHCERAEREGWIAEAMQVRPDGMGEKLDWNDLLKLHKTWTGDPDRAPLSRESFEEYRWNGAVTIAKTAREKARLIADHKVLSAFDFRHGNRTWYCKVRHDQDNSRILDVEEIANCAFRLLYRERDEIADETNYFIQIDFPDQQPTVKARFSAAACANSGEFKKRLMAFGGMWVGTGEQLDRIMRVQTRRLKVVEPLPFTGYSAAHRAWVLGDIGVHQGRVVSVNTENYFDFGKKAVKLRSAERMLDIHYDADQIKFGWVADFWTAFGPKGLIALAFFSMSLFAVQIREKHKSLGFLEVTGPPGSGKSTMMEFLWKLLGRGGYEGFDPSKSTPAFIARSMLKVSNLPVGLIEGNRKSDDQKSASRQYDYNELLVLYGGRSPRGTGKKSSGYETDEPNFLGSIYLMQNERITAIPAVLERLMSMQIDRSRWSADGKDAAIRIEQWPIEEISGTIVHIIRQEAAFLHYFFQRFEHHDLTMGQRVPALSLPRAIKCHSQLAAGVDALPSLIPGIRPEWIAETINYVDYMALDRQQSIGGDHPLVANFWEKYEYLTDRESDEAHAEGKSLNQSRNPTEIIAVNLVHFEARCSAAGLTRIDMDKLKSILRDSKSRKFLAQKKVNNPAGKIVSCWVFQQPAAAERII